MLKFYDTNKEMQKDIKEMRKKGYLVISENTHNLSVKYIYDGGNEDGKDIK